MPRVYAGNLRFPALLWCTGSLLARRRDRARAGAPYRQGTTDGRQNRRKCDSICDVLDRSTIWPYEDGKPGRFYYSRFASPPVVEAERQLGELDGGTAL